MFRRRVVRAGLCASWFIVCAAASIACGDDDDSPKGDAGTGGVSAGASSSGKGGASGAGAGAGAGAGKGAAGTTGPGVIPRVDGGLSSSDPVPPCTRNGAMPCQAGQTCDVVIRQAVGAMELLAYNGCVDSSRDERGAGDICDLDLTNGPIYTAPGLADEVRREPCGPGLVCAPARDVLGLGRCQTACSSGEIIGPPEQINCADANDLCLPATQVTEYCRKLDGCDPVKQTGCRPNSGEACFLTFSDDLRRIVSVCQIPLSMPSADGAACTSRFSCNVGSSCLGPSSRAPDQWQTGDLKCRRVCGANSGGASAADDSDAGVPLGECASKSTCEPFTTPGTLLSTIPTPPHGLCEP